MARSMHFLKFSGETPEDLRNLLKEYINVFLNHANDWNFANAAFKANVEQGDYNHRAFVVATGFEDAAKKLNSGKFQLASCSEIKNSPKLCFLFPGQGCQYSGMAHTLYDTSPVFREHFDLCCDILQTTYDIPLKSVIFEIENALEVHRTLYSQTGIFAVEYSLLKLWESFGIKPDYVLGHGVGEFTAAVAAGFLSFEDAIMLVATRTKLIDALPNGSMIAMQCNQYKAREILEDNNLKLDIAAMNSNGETVISGGTQCISRLEDICDEDDIATIDVTATHAFHSRHMDAMIEDYHRVTETVDYRRRSNENAVFISSLTGEVVNKMNSEYWANSARQPVNFVRACTKLVIHGVRDFLEIGPQPFLIPSLSKNLGSKDLTLLPSIRNEKDDWEVLLKSLGQLYLLGHQIDWKGFDAPYHRGSVTDLPTNSISELSDLIDLGQRY